MSTSSNQDRSPKDLFWEIWLTKNTYDLTRHYPIGAYVADFAHLPTKTVIEFDSLAQEVIRNQVKRAGWQIVHMNPVEVERNIHALVQKMMTLITNKTVYLHKKEMQAPPNEPARAIELREVARNSEPVKPPAPPTCRQCGRELPPYVHEQLCYPCLTRERKRQEKVQVITWAKAMMSHTDWVVIDTETTGMTKTAEIIEIAMVNSQGTTILDTLVKPLQHIPSSASRVHGISDKDVVGAPSFADLWPNLLTYFQDSTILAYNAKFDLRLLAQTAQQQHIPFPQNVQYTCLMQQYKTYLRADETGAFPSPSLQKACEQLGIQAGQHRALGDAQVAWGVLKKLSEQEIVR